MMFDKMSKVIYFGNIFPKDKDHSFSLRVIVDNAVVVVVVAVVVVEVVLIVVVVGQTVGENREGWFSDDENFFPIHMKLADILADK